MPVYNAERYIVDAIASILNQTYRDFELLLLDDCSTDNSAKIAKSFLGDSRVRMFYNEQNCGIAESRNRLLSESRGKYIALMDDDDIAPENRLEIEKEYLDGNSEVGVVCGRTAIMNSRGQITRPFNTYSYYNPRFLSAMLLFEDPIPNGTAMIRRELVNQYNLRYRNEQYGLEDYRFWAEVSCVTKITSLNDVLLIWRNHNSETWKMREEFAEQRECVYRSIKKYILESKGYDLGEDDLRTFYKLFAEMTGICETEDDLKRLHNIMQIIIEQTSLENKTEMIAACKEIYARKTKTASFLWSSIE